MATKTNNKDVSEKKIKRALDFKLKESDYADMGKKAADLAREVGELDVQFDGVKKEWKGKIEIKENELDKVLRVIRAGVESRLVDCIERKVFDRNVVEYVYNGEVMFSRTMELAEKQMEFDSKVTKESKKVLTRKLSDEVKEEKEEQAEEKAEEKPKKKTKHEMRRLAIMPPSQDTTN